MTNNIEELTLDELWNLYKGLRCLNSGIVIKTARYTVLNEINRREKDK